jgi:hypothetical protein
VKRATAGAGTTRRGRHDQTPRTFTVTALAFLGSVGQ